MQFIRLSLFFLFLTVVAHGQVISKDTTKMGYVLVDTDEVLNDTIQLEEIIVSKEKLDPDAKKRFLILQSRVYITYPYAKLASERLTLLNRGMTRLSANRANPPSNGYHDLRIGKNTEKRVESFLV